MERNDSRTEVRKDSKDVSDADAYQEPEYPNYGEHYAQNPVSSGREPEGSHYLSPWTGRYW